MPAPTPIVMRYGDDGLLGQAAATAGYGTGLLDLQHRQQALHQQGYAADLDFISQQMARRQQADQFAQQQQMQANELQQAAARQQQQPGNPSGTVTDTGNTIRGMKTLAISNIIGDTQLDPAVRDQLSSLTQHDNIPLADVSHLATQAVAAAKGIAEKKAKQDYVKTVLPSLPADEQAGLSALANSDRVTPEQLRVAVDEVKSRVGVQTRQHTQAQLTGIDAQQRRLVAQARELEKQLTEAGFKADAGPAQFNPTYADPNAATFGTEGFKGSLGDAFGGTGKLVTGGNPEALSTYRQYAEVTRQLQELQGQRDQIVKGGSPAGNPAAGQQQQADAANPAAHLSDADLLKALGS